MPTLIATGATEVIKTWVQSALTMAGLTGAGSTIRIEVKRRDGFFLDFNDNTFKASGWTTRQTAMTESDAANVPGLYTYSLNTALIANPVANDVYQVIVEQVGATTAANLPQTGELRVGGILDTIAANLNATVASRAAAGDAMALTPAERVATSAVLLGTTVPGAFPASTVGGRLDAPISSRAAQGDAMSLVDNAISAAKLAPGALTSAAFATDAIAGSAVAASAVTKLQGGLASASAVAALPTAGQNAAATWEEPLAAHVAANTFATLVKTALDVPVSSRSTLTAPAVWQVQIPGGFAPGEAGAVVGLALDAPMTSRLAASAYAPPPSAAVVASQVWATALPGAFLVGEAGAILGTMLDVPVSSRLPASAYQAPPAASVVASQVWSTALPGSFAIGEAGFIIGMTLDAPVTSRLALVDYSPPPSPATVASEVDAVLSAAHGAGNWIGLSAVEVENAVHDGLLVSHAVPGSFGVLWKSSLDAPVSTRATPADVVAARDAVRGIASLTISDLAGPGFSTTDDSLHAASAWRAMFADQLGDFQNSTQFSSAIPLLVRPASGSVSYVLRVAVDAPDGTPSDPDANAIAVTVSNGAGADRGSHLSSSTMTRIGQGRYQVAYTVSDLDPSEQLLFTFSYAQAGMPITRDRPGSVVADATTGFTTGDRATLAAILADTGVIERVVSATLDAPISSLRGAGYVEGTDSLHAIASSMSAFGSLGLIIDQVWAHPARTLTGPGASGLATSAELTARFDEIKGSPWSSATDNLHAIYGQAHGGMTSTAAFQAAALAAIAGVPDDVWDVVLQDHQLPNSTGEALLSASRAPLATAIADEVWASAQTASPGTMGFAQILMRKWVTNRIEETAGNPGKIELYDDDGATLLLQWPLRDANGGAVLAGQGLPARRGAAT